MTKNPQSSIIPELVEKRIYLLRGKRVMLSSDLAELYGVSAGALIQAVHRNRDRFPSDFMYQLTDKEVINLKSQIVISSWGGSRRANPYAFTEQGVAMLSSVLKSKRAIQVNIKIIRIFVNMRELVIAHKDLWLKIDELEKKYDHQFQVVFKAIKLILEKSKEGPENRL